ncbi:jg25933, partial [Pararge aegeria aegeria]
MLAKCGLVDFKHHSFHLVVGSQDDPGSTNIDTVSAFVGTRSKCLAVCVPPSVVFTNDNIIKSKSSSLEIAMTTSHISPLYPRKLKPESLYERRQCLNHRFASPRLLHLSPCRANRPSSRNSLSSRLSSSHNSLVSQFQADDSSFITQAISHDTLSAKTSDITDMYNVPFDSDIYAVPIDTVRPSHSNVRGKGKKPPRSNRKRGKSSSQILGSSSAAPERVFKSKEIRHKDTKTKRHSLPSSSSKKPVTDSDTDSLHLTLREMRKYLHTLYSSSSDSECRNTVNKKSNTIITNVGIHVRHANKEATGTAVFLKESNDLPRPVETNNNHKKANKNTVSINAKHKKHKEITAKESGVLEESKDKSKKGNQ